MAKPQWSDAFSVGDVEVDSQHRMLFELLGSLLDLAAKPTASHRELSEAVHGLTTYARVHFDTEEELWLSRAPHRYPEHRRMHEQFRARAAELEHELAAGKPIDPLMLAAELQAWIVQHLMVEDQLLKPGAA
ncbi:MAG: bacteriohemerythrin [Fimbriimonadaceae bacterium]